MIEYFNSDINFWFILRNFNLDYSNYSYVNHFTNNI